MTRVESASVVRRRSCCYDEERRVRCSVEDPVVLRRGCCSDEEESMLL